MSRMTLPQFPREIVKFNQELKDFQAEWMQSKQAEI